MSEIFFVAIKLSVQDKQITRYLCSNNHTFKHQKIKRILLIQEPWIFEAAKMDKILAILFKQKINTIFNAFPDRKTPKWKVSIQWNFLNLLFQKIRQIFNWILLCHTNLPSAQNHATALGMFWESWPLKAFDKICLGLRKANEYYDWCYCFTEQVFYYISSDI